MRPNNWEDQSYNNVKEDNRPYMDDFLKKTIEQAFITFERMRRGERKVYFTGNWQKDVLACFPGRQSNKVFKKMSVFLDNNKEYCFTQKKLENIEGYEYIVIRR